MRRLRAIWLLEELDVSRLPGHLLIPAAGAVGVAVVFALLRFDIVWIYTESTAFLVLAVALGLFARTTGLVLVTAYVVGDLVREAFSPPEYDPVPLGRFISYVLLWALVVFIPLQQRRLAGALTFELGRRGIGPSGARVIASGLASIVAGTLVYLWANAAAYLIRPVFPGYAISAAFVPIQDGSFLLGAVAAVVSFGYSMTLRRDTSSAADGLALVDLKEVRGRWAIAARALGIIIALVVLAGFITGPLDLALLGGALVIGALAPWALGRVPLVWQLLARIPRAARLVVAFGLTFAVSEAIGSLYYYPAFGSEFFPLVVSLAIGIVLFGVLAAPPTIERPPPGAPRAPRDTVALAAVLLGISGMAALFAMLALPGPVAADNCSALNDCNSVFGAQVAVEVALLAVFLASQIFNPATWQGPNNRDQGYVNMADDDHDYGTGTWWKSHSGWHRPQGPLYGPPTSAPGHWNRGGPPAGEYWLGGKG